MAMKPGADLDSLPFLDNPNDFDVNAYAAFIMELSYVATNNLTQLHSFKSYSTPLLWERIGPLCQIGFSPDRNYLAR